MKKSVSLFLFATILLQSCVAYHSTPLPIDQAYERGGGVKIISKLGDRYIFNGIYLKDSIYYGVKGDELVRLDTAQILSIYLQDVKKSKNQTTVATKVVPPVVVIVAIVIGAVLVISATAYFIIMLFGAL